MQHDDGRTTAQGIIVRGDGALSDYYVMTDQESDHWAQSEGAESAALIRAIQTALEADGTDEADVCLADSQVVLTYRRPAQSARSRVEALGTLEREEEAWIAKRMRDHGILGSPRQMRLFIEDIRASLLS